MEPLVTTGEEADLDRVMLAGAVTVVVALPQLVVVHEELGVAGLVLPVGSTEA